MGGVAIIISGCTRRSGKTALTCGLARALAREGRRVGALKIGSDRIDAGYLAHATGRECQTLDAWAMRLETLTSLLTEALADVDILLIEGAGGLFDGAPLLAGAGGVSTGELAALLGLPVLLAVDAGAFDVSAVPMIDGFLRFREDVAIVGLAFTGIVDEVQHRRLARACDDRFSTPILGWIDAAAAGLDAHGLGSVSGANRALIDSSIEAMADAIAARLDTGRLMRLARPPALNIYGPPAVPLAPIGQRIAVAEDDSCGFALPAVAAGWRRLGAELLPFSPLADEAPCATSDAVFLPDGGSTAYLGRLATNRTFIKGLHAAGHRDAFIHAEGGGYPLLGEWAIDAVGQRHAMAALLPVTLDLREASGPGGFVEVTPEADTPVARRSLKLRGYLRPIGTEAERRGEALFRARLAPAVEPSELGSRLGTVAGSFLQLIDRAPHLGVVRN